MRMKHSRRTSLTFKNRTVTKDTEGVTLETYGTAFTLVGEKWQASGQLMAETYGERINNMFNVRIEGNYTKSLVNGVETYTFGNNSLKVGDAMCIGGTDANFRIISIKDEKPLRMTVEKI